MKILRTILVLAIACVSFSAFAQTVTPNAALQLPAYQQQNWQVPLLFDMARIDNIFGGTVPIPSITLSGAITNANQAVTKAYVDATAVGFLSASGATMTGPLVLAADPTAPLQAATKQYVDNAVASGGGTGSLTATAINTALGYTAQSAANVSAAIAAEMTATPSYTTVTLTGAITSSTQAATKAYVDAAIAGVSASTFTGGTLTQTLILAANPTTNLGAATKQYVDAAVVGFLSQSGGTLSGPLTLSDGTLAASEAYVASAVSGLSGGGTTNQQLDQKVTSASSWNKICTAAGTPSGTVACAGVQGNPIAVNVATKQASPVLNTVGVTNAVATYGLSVNSSTNTQILVPTTVGTNYAATVFKREMWFTGGTNLNGVDNFETDTYMFDLPDQWEFMMGWQCRRNAASPNTGSDFWQYDNFKGGWKNSAVPCSIIAGHVYHYILMMHRDLASSTACSGTGADASVTAGPCEHWDTFKLDDLTASTTNTYTLNLTYVAEPASLGGWQTWTGIGSQVQLDVIDSSTGGTTTPVSMIVDDDSLTTYVPVTSSGGGSTSVTETTGNLGEYDFDGASPTSGLTATGSPTIDTTNSYSSPNAVLFNAANEYYTAPITSSSTVFARAEVNVTTAPTTSSTQFLGLYNGSSQLINLFFNSVDGLIKANNTAGTNTVTTCSASGLTPGTWHRVELAWTQNATSGSFQVLIDGTSTCNVTGVTTGSLPATSVHFGEMGAPSPAWVFDLDNVGFSSTGLLGAVTINSGSTNPLYDLYGSAAAVQIADQEYSSNASHLSSGTIPPSVFPAIIPGSVGAAIASASTIAPVASLTHITGTTSISTITPPYSGFTGCLVLIADGGWPMTTGGNIMNAFTATTGTMYRACDDGTNGWYVK
jgi:hypothetical protein